MYWLFDAISKDSPNVSRGDVINPSGYRADSCFVQLLRQNQGTRRAAVSTTRGPFWRRALSLLSVAVRARRGDAKGSPRVKARSPEISCRARCRTGRRSGCPIEIGRGVGKRTGGAPRVLRLVGVRVCTLEGRLAIKRCLSRRQLSCVDRLILIGVWRCISWLSRVAARRLHVWVIKALLSLQRLLLRLL